MSTYSARSAPRRPARLFEGARVALVAPAGPVSEERVEAACAHCRDFGLVPVVGAAARLRKGYLAGPDHARLGDLQNAINDDSIDAIWAIRGGYGTMRILQRIDWSRMIRRPRAFIGFSDNTAIHLALRRCGVGSFHAPHPGSTFTAFSKACFRAILFEGMTGALPVPPAGTTRCVARGEATGRLVGGNLALLASLAGTEWALRAQGGIVLLEDVGEATYRIDRALVQLILSGAFEGVVAFAIGQFTEQPTATNDRDVVEVIEELLSPLGVPIVSGLPFGHIDEQWSLPLGALARLDAGAGTVELLEAGVA